MRLNELISENSDDAEYPFDVDRVVDRQTLIDMINKMDIPQLVKDAAITLAAFAADSGSHDRNDVTFGVADDTNNGIGIILGLYNM